MHRGLTMWRGVCCVYCSAVRGAIIPGKTKLVMVESPTNPRMQVRRTHTLMQECMVWCEEAVGAAPPCHSRRCSDVVFLTKLKVTIHLQVALLLPTQQCCCQLMNRCIAMSSCLQCVGIVFAVKVAATVVVYNRLSCTPYCRCATFVPSLRLLMLLVQSCAWIIASWAPCSKGP